MTRFSTVIFVLYMLLAGCKTKDGEREISVNQGLDIKAEPKDVLEGGGFKVKVYDFEGFETLLYRRDDKTYVVNFWATWCKPCIEELPHFEAINSKYRSRDVEVVLVSLDFPSRADELLIPFIEKRNLKSHVLLLDDPKQNTWIPKVDKQWSGALPATIIFNDEKRSFYEKSFTFNELESELLSFLK